VRGPRHRYTHVSGLDPESMVGSSRRFSNFCAEWVWVRVRFSVIRDLRVSPQVNDRYRDVSAISERASPSERPPGRYLTTQVCSIPSYTQYCEPAIAPSVRRLGEDVRYDRVRTGRWVCAERPEPSLRAPTDFIFSAA
jgi:hypothetical protein